MTKNETPSEYSPINYPLYSAPSRQNLFSAVKNAVMGVFFPKQPLQQEVKMNDMMIFSTDALIRSKYAAYPIFSLRKSDADMIQEYRDRCRSLDIPFSEIDLPGATEPEVGFVTSWKNTEKIG